MEIVHEPIAKKLLDCGNPAANADVLAVCGGGSLLHGRMNSICNKMEGSSARHRNRITGVACQHKYRSVVRRVFTPPAFPVFVRPRSSNRTEHVTANDPCSNVLEAASGEIIVNSRCSLIFSVEALKGARWEHPIVLSEAAATERIFEALIRTSPVPVNRDC